jgi:ATP-dependent exoDNAse (exonuclease V) alpha subunit
MSRENKDFFLTPYGLMKDFKYDEKLFMKDRFFSHFFELQNFQTHMFTYDNLPETIEENYLEMYFTSNGTVAATKTEKGLVIRFSVGDPVMQLENRRECANGDVGFVTHLEKGKLFVSFSDGTKVIYTHKNINQLSLAYSMSINKSQGSEYKSVVMAMTTEHSAMLKRNLLYTGVTRAKKKLTLIKEDSALIQAINCEDEYTRHTFLIEKLQFLERRNGFFIKEEM